MRRPRRRGAAGRLPNAVEPAAAVAADGRLFLGPAGGAAASAWARRELAASRPADDAATRNALLVLERSARAWSNRCRPRARICRARTFPARFAGRQSCRREPDRSSPPGRAWSSPTWPAPSSPGLCWTRLICAEPSWRTPCSTEPACWRGLACGPARRATFRRARLIGTQLPADFRAAITRPACSARPSPPPHPPPGFSQIRVQLQCRGPQSRRVLDRLRARRRRHPTLGHPDRKGNPRLAGHHGSVRSVAFSPDGQTLASGSTTTPSDSGTPRPARKSAPAGAPGLGQQRRLQPRWQTSPAARTTTPSDSGTPDRKGDPRSRGTQGCRQERRLQPRWGNLASGRTTTPSDSGTPRPERRSALQGHPGSVRSVAFSPDGKTLASGSATNPSDSGTPRPERRSAPARGTPARSRASPSAPMAKPSPAARTTTPSDSGTPRPERRSAPARGTQARSGASPSAPMGKPSPAARTTTPSDSGTPRPERKSAPPGHPAPSGASPSAPMANPRQRLVRQLRPTLGHPDRKGDPHLRGAHRLGQERRLQPRWANPRQRLGRQLRPTLGHPDRKGDPRLRGAHQLGRASPSAPMGKPSPAARTTTPSDSGTPRPERKSRLRGTPARSGASPSAPMGKPSPAARTTTPSDSGTPRPERKSAPCGAPGLGQERRLQPRWANPRQRLDDNSVRLWDTQTGKEIRALGAHRLVRSVAFSPDGQTLASGSDDKSVRLWDTQTGKEILALRGAHHALS